MAITFTNKGSLFSGTNAATYSTASYTPAADKLLLALIVNENNVAGADPVEPVVTGNGLTWTRIVTFVPDNSGSKVRMSLWGALTGASPAAGALTADFSADSTVELGCSIIVDQVAGVDMTGGTVASCIVQSVVGSINTSGTSESITLAALSNANNASYGGFNTQIQEAMVAGSGYTITTQGNNAGPTETTAAEFKVPGSTTVNITWTTSAAKGGLAAEIKAGVFSVVADAGSFAENGQADIFSIAQVSNFGSFS